MSFRRFGLIAGISNPPIRAVPDVSALRLDRSGGPVNLTPWRFMQHKSEQPFIHLDAETIDHLTDEMPKVIRELEELHFLVEKLSRKGQRRMEKIRRHMMMCGLCLSKQMRIGLLAPIEDYWESVGADGTERRPRLELLNN